MIANRSDAALAMDRPQESRAAGGTEVYPAPADQRECGRAGKEFTVGEWRVSLPARAAERETVMAAYTKSVRVVRGCSRRDAWKP